MGEKELVSALRAQGLFVATAESISAGLVAAEITNVAGSSEVFLGGVVAYQNSVKQELLGVSPQLMAQQGAVDAEVAAQMAAGVRQRFAKINQVESQQVIGISTTGVAGPGESEGKPQGTVFIGISSNAGDAVYAYDFSGSRDEVRKQTVDAALQSLWEQLQVLIGY
ncbi:MAG TPA: nicotinamide-nucleotide amidohydrolase family protein [Aquiluna sp.]